MLHGQVAEDRWRFGKDYVTEPDQRWLQYAAMIHLMVRRLN
jgi:hypothetical protein